MCIKLHFFKSLTMKQLRITQCRELWIIEKVDFITSCQSRRKEASFKNSDRRGRTSWLWQSLFHYNNLCCLPATYRTTEWSINLAFVQQFQSNVLLKLAAFLNILIETKTSFAAKHNWDMSTSNDEEWRKQKNK